MNWLSCALVVALVAMCMRAGWAGRTRSGASSAATPAEIERALWRVALGACAGLAIDWTLASGIVRSDATAHALELAWGISALLAWSGLATLAFRSLRRRDWWLAIPGTFAIAGLAADPVVSGTAFTTFLALARWRWQSVLTRRASGWAIVGALAIAVLTIVAPAVHPALGRSMSSALRGFGATTASVIVLYAAFSLPGLVRRSALAIRSIDRRLAVLLMLATDVPLVLLLTLWAITTFLGVGSDRALSAAREVTAEARSLESALGLALSAPDRAESRLHDLAAIYQRRGLPLEIWLRRGAWIRVAGDSTFADSTLERWPRIGAAAPVAVQGNHSYVGARVHSLPDSEQVAIALLPLRGAFGDDLTRRVDGRVVFQGMSGESFTVQSAGVKISQEPEPPRPRRRFQFTTPRSRPPQSASLNLPPFDGYSSVPGYLERRGAWIPSTCLLQVHIDFIRALTGLYRHVAETPFSLVPMVLIVMFTLLCLTVMAVDFAMVRALGRSITGAVNALRGGVEALETGRLEHRIEVKGDDDLWDVASAFNRMAEGLERGRRLEIERERVEGELALARRIQSRLLPAAPPNVPGMDIAGASAAALQVGGDYYDHLLLPDGRVALVVADVSGKGVPAALLMSGFRASLMSHLTTETDPAIVLARVNRFMHASVESGRFVTAFLAILDPASGLVAYTNAGHNSPVVVDREGQVTRLETGGLLLGIMENSAFERGEIVLAHGARLVLFTDGVTEAQDPAGVMWGEEPLLEMLASNGERVSAEMVARIVQAVREFEGGGPPSDDITVLVARRI